MITIEQLKQCASGLDDNDFVTYAERVAKIDPILGELQRLHAEAADGNSPPVSDWPRYTIYEAQKMEEAGTTTIEEARGWWFEQYIPTA